MLCATPVAAQTVSPADAPGAVVGTPTGKLRTIGADVTLAIPFNDWGDVAGLGFGVFGRYEQHLAPFLAATGRLGYVYHLSQETSAAGITVKSQVSVVPLLVGARYSFVPAIFVHAEIGPVLVNSSTDTTGVPGVPGTTGSNSNDFKLMVSIGGGYRLANVGPGSLLLSAYLQMVSLADAGDTMQLAATAGYDFVSF